MLAAVAGDRMSTYLKIVLGVVVSAIVVLAAAAAYMVHRADLYLPEMIAYVQKKTGKQIEIRHVTVELFPLAVRLYDVGIKNPKPFPPGYFLKAPTIDATIYLGPLLHRKISIKSLVLDKPVIDFISDPDGLWNFQNPVASNKPVQKSPRLSMGPISRLQINGGVLLGSALIDPSDRPGPVILEVRNFRAQVQQINFDAFKDPDASATVAGSLQADTARFGDVNLKNLRSQLQVEPLRLTFKGFRAKTYRGQASGDFTFNFAGSKTKFNTDLQVSGVGVAYLLKEFQNGPPKMTGMMQADLKLAGEVEHTSNPLAGVNGGGRFTIRDGRLPSLDQSKNMKEMKRFRSPEAAGRPVSAFSSFAGDMELRNHRIYNKQVGIDFYGIDVDGSGNLNEVNGGMDYRGVATILKKQGFFTNVAARMFKGADEKQGRLSFPIRVSGTLQNPQLSVVR